MMAKREPLAKRWTINEKAGSFLLSRFFMAYWFSQEVWPQILGRDLQDFSSRTSKSLPEICGQTKPYFLAIDYQYVTKLYNFHQNCQYFLPIFTPTFLSFFPPFMMQNNHRESSGEWPYWCIIISFSFLSIKNSRNSI